jgi:hypothetical protein
MTTITLTGTITENGKLEVQLPEGLMPGDVQVSIALPDDELPLSDEEVTELLRPVTPRNGAEIAAALEASEATSWETVSDGAAWVEEQRRRRREHRGW